MKQVLVRLDESMAEELRRAVFHEDLTATEIIRQALAIRLRALPPDTLSKVLEKIGYQEGRPPGRPPAEARAAANGSTPLANANTSADDWSLEPGS